MKKKFINIIMILSALLLILNGCATAEGVTENIDEAIEPVIEEIEDMNYDEDIDHELDDEEPDENVPVDSEIKTLQYTIEPLSDAYMHLERRDRSIGDIIVGYVDLDGYLDSGRFEVVNTYTSDKNQYILIYDENDNIIHEILSDVGFYVSNVLVDNINKQIILQVYDSNKGPAFFAVDFEGNKVFDLHYTSKMRGSIHSISQNSSGNYVVVHSLICHESDSDIQGLFADIFDSNGNKMETIILLPGSEVEHKIDDDGIYYLEVVFNVIGVIDDDVYFIISRLTSINPTIYRSYMNVFNLKDGSWENISINDALELDYVACHNTRYMNKEDLRIVFPINKYIYENGEYVRTDHRIAVFDIKQENFLVTSIIEDLYHNAIKPLGNYRFWIDIINTSASITPSDPYMLTLVFE